MVEDHTDMKLGQYGVGELVTERVTESSSPACSTEFDTGPVSERAKGSELFFAVADHSIDLVRTMLAARADPNVCDYENRRPLHVSAGHGKHVDIVQLLIDYRAEINVVDFWGLTPLLQAQNGGNFEIEDLLKDRGAKLQKSRLQRQSLREKWEIKRSDVKVREELSRTLKSVIHRATWNSIDVVAKFALAETADVTSEDMEEELLHEISVLATIRHPDLVMFLGCCLQETPIMFISQFMPGGDLERYYKSKQSEERWDTNPWTPATKDVNRWGRSILRALSFLHHCARPIIHRDLKPLNILLTDSFDVKVTDFGISKDTHPYIKGSSSINSGKVDSYFMTGGVGSWRYMAPEVARHQVYTEKVDIYSFALVLYFMSSGRQPFYDYTKVEDVLAEYANGGEPRPKSSQCPSCFRPVMEAAWRIIPDERPSAEELHEVLVEANSNPSKCTCIAM